MNQNFGQMVKIYRHQLELTQSELAERASCATITIRRIEGNTLRPSVQLAEKLAEVLAIPANENGIFINMARTNSSSNVSEEEAMTANGNQLIRARRRKSYLLTFLPLFLVFLVIVVNPNYLFALVAHQTPFIITGVLPWGWVVVLVVAGLMYLTYRVLEADYRKSGTHQEVQNRDLSGPVLLFLTFPTMLIILVAPAVLHVFRSGVLN